MDNTPIIDIAAWTSSIPEVNEYLKTHDSFTIRYNYNDKYDKTRQGTTKTSYDGLLEFKKQYLSFNDFSDDTKYEIIMPSTNDTK